MNYELAKELKEAGFPQDTHFGYDPEGHVGCLGDGINKMPLIICAPNLSELIEACGGSIQNYDDESQQLNCLKRVYASDFSGRIVWEASTGTYRNASEGNTPDEAVAKLWLTLNKKQ